MRSLTSSPCLVSIFILWLCLSGCEPSEETDERPKELVYGFVMGADPEAQLNRYEKITAYLSEEVGMNIKFVKGTDYAAVIEAMKTGKVHIAATGPFSYLIASAKANAEPLVATRYTQGGINYYGSCLITSANSGLQRMEEVQARASELSIAFADPASTSGYLYPLSHLRSLGLEPEENFKEVLFAGGHTAGIFAAISGKVDLMGTSITGLERLTRAGRIQEDQFRVLWQSEEIPPTPVYVRKDLPEDLKQKLRDAYVHMHERAPELMEMVRQRSDKDIVYVAVGDTLYADLRSKVNLELEGLLVEE